MYNHIIETIVYYNILNYLLLGPVIPLLYSFLLKYCSTAISLLIIYLMGLSFGILLDIYNPNENMPMIIKLSLIWYMSLLYYL